MAITLIKVFSIRRIVSIFGPLSCIPVLKISIKQQMMEKVIQNLPGESLKTYILLSKL